MLDDDNIPTHDEDGICEDFPNCPCGLEAAQEYKGLDLYTLLSAELGMYELGNEGIKISALTRALGQLVGEAQAKTLEMHGKVGAAEFARSFQAQYMFAVKGGKLPDADEVIH